MLVVIIFSPALPAVLIILWQVEGVTTGNKMRIMRCRDIRHKVIIWIRCNNEVNGSQESIKNEKKFQKTNYQ